MSKDQHAPLPGQSDKIVQVENLSKKYGDNIAVNGISFSLTKGEVFAFLGPNGAGKTTTVEILECLRNPTGGQAKVLGYDVSKRSDQAEIRKRIGVLPQDFNAIDRLTVRENINYFGAMFKHQLDADKLIELVDLKDKRDEQFKKLSGGLKQRVGLAVSLVNDPDVVFLDEPTTGLDPRARRALEEPRKNGLPDNSLHGRGRVPSRHRLDNRSWTDNRFRDTRPADRHPRRKENTHHQRRRGRGAQTITPRTTEGRA